MEDVARALAAAHAADSHDDLRVYWQRVDGDTVRLIEVSAHFFPSPEGDSIRAFGFAPDRLQGIPYRVEVALATAEEWLRFECDDVDIGGSWRRADFTRIWPR